MKFAVVVFPGSNCDHDAYHAAKHVLGQQAELIWHKDTEPQGADVVDPARRVRARRLSAHRRDRALLADHAARCRRSPRPAGRCSASATAFRCCSRPDCCRARCCGTAACKYRCEHVHVRVEQTDTPFTRACRAGQVLRIPIAHGEGNYYAEPDVIDRLETNRQVVFRYVTAAGRRDRRRESERLGEQHRRHLQRGAATSSA